MTSKQNTFRLGRLSNTSDFRKNSISEYTNNPKDILKLAALTSINQSVKYNDLSFITGRELPKLRKQPQDGGNNLQYGSAHENLTTVRRKYDTINKQKLQCENKIDMLREQREKYLTIEDQYLSNKDHGNQKVKSMEDNLHQTKLQFEETDWNRKVLHMLAERIKHDKIVYDQRKFDLEKELSHYKKQLKIFVKQGTGINQETDRTSKVYQKLVKQLQSQQAERQEHLQSLSGMFHQRMIVNQSNSMRKNQIEEIALKAMQDKDENEKNWSCILQANRFMDNLLRDKMEKEMEKFTLVETAFKTIKIATGVSDAQQLIFKFLNKEQVYGELLSKIADNEKKMTGLKHEKETLLKERKGLKEQQQQYLFSKKEEINLHDELKELEEITQKEISAGLKTERIREYILRNLKKMYNFEKAQKDLTFGKSNTVLTASFKKYLNLLSQQVEKCGNEVLKLKKASSQDEMKPDNKLFRVKLRTKKINLSGEEVENEFEEEDIQNLNEQQDLIVGQRSDILKQNERFMKELKKKTDEVKKLRMDAEPKKKAVTTSPEKKNSIVEQ